MAKALLQKEFYRHGTHYVFAVTAAPALQRGANHKNNTVEV
jgi:hypothetical protein